MRPGQSRKFPEFSGSVGRILAAAAGDRDSIGVGQPKSGAGFPSQEGRGEQAGQTLRIVRGLSGEVGLVVPVFRYPPRPESRDRVEYLQGCPGTGVRDPRDLFGGWLTFGGIP